MLGRRFLTALLVFAMGYLRNRMRSLRTRQAAADVYSSLRRDHFMIVLRKKIRRIAESDLLLRNPWNVCLGWDRSGCKGRVGEAWDANWWTEIIERPTCMVGADPCSSTGDPVPWWLTLCQLNISSCPLYLCQQLQQLRAITPKYLTTPITPKTMAILEESGKESPLWANLVNKLFFNTKA